jgi:hypothetical protein
MNLYCHICYSTNTEEYFICDRCENHYCEECSYTHSIHYQYEGSLCYWCSDQNRRKKLTKEIIRNNKMKLILNL